MCVAACCGPGRMMHLVYGVCAIMRTGCRVQRFAHAAGCPLPAARCTRNAAVPCVSSCISHVLASSCMSSAVACPLNASRCPLPVPGCLLWSFLRGVCCLLHAACGLLPCCLLSGARRLLSFPRCLLSVACCPLPVARCTVSVALHVIVARCVLLAVWRMLPVARCMSSVVRCILPAACCPDVVCCMFHVMSSVACCLLSVVCCLLRICQWSREGRLLRHCCPSDRVCCTLCAAYRTLVTLRVGHCESSRCMLHGPHPLSHAVPCPSPAPILHVVGSMLSLVRCLCNLAWRLLHAVIA
jgi:hypothetical protein